MTTMEIHNTTDWRILLNKTGINDQWEVRIRTPESVIVVGMNYSLNDAVAVGKAMATVLPQIKAYETFMAELSHSADKVVVPGPAPATAEEIAAVAEVEAELDAIRQAIQDIPPFVEVADDVAREMFKKQVLAGTPWQKAIVGSGLSVSQAKGIVRRLRHGPKGKTVDDGTKELATQAMDYLHSIGVTVLNMGNNTYDIGHHEGQSIQSLIAYANRRREKNGLPALVVQNGISVSAPPASPAPSSSST